MSDLIVFRGLQGIGAGTLMAIAITIIGDIMPGETRGKPSSWERRECCRQHRRI
ncbi:MFS transporter [Paenibacillus ferrarius]|uniref:MFS transporter n=1 Tax=Paenibacillus ferrarius TaxID=1469647 RepID=UPI00117E4DC0|nr:MFS transporter [Paenibacillus ferrarius]